MLDALRRTRPTPPLASMSAQRRSAELQGAIVVRESRRRALAGRHVLLIDDVLTSGATARSCARALLEAGAGAVDVLAAARVHSPGHD
jgi:predicted amidophosphoribosyltransferase